MENKRKNHESMTTTITADKQALIKPKKILKEKKWKTTERLLNDIMKIDARTEQDEKRNWIKVIKFKLIDKQHK